MYYERLMSLAGLEKRAYPQNGYGVNGQQNPPGAPAVQNAYGGSQQSRQKAAISPWEQEWNRRKKVKIDSYNAGAEAGQSVRNFFNQTGHAISKGWDAVAQGAEDYIGRPLAKGLSYVANGANDYVVQPLEAAGKWFSGFFSGDDTANKWQSPEEIEAQRRAENERKYNEQLAKRQRQEAEQSAKSRAKREAERQAEKDRMAQEDARLAERRKFRADMEAWRQADPESYKRYIAEKYKDGRFDDAKPGTPEWEASEKFSRDALAKWQATQNPSQQTQQQPAPAPGAPQVQQPSQQQQPAPAPGAPQVQQPSQQQQPAPAQAPKPSTTPVASTTTSQPAQPRVAPAAGAPTVQQPAAAQTPKPVTTQAPKPTANTNYQDPGRWNNTGRPTGRPGY